MSSTKAQVIAEFQTVYSNCDPSFATSLFDYANRIICSRVQARNGTVSVSLTSGQQEYQHDPSGLITQTHEVYYWPSATASAATQLTQMDPDRLAAFQTNWRSQSQTTGIPTEYYILSATANGASTGGQAIIGFYPVPPTTTSAGYPIAIMNVTTAATLSSGDNVPVNLLSDDIYVYLMCERFCSYRFPEDLPRWFDQSMGKYKSEIEIEKNILFQRQMGPNAGMSDLGSTGSTLIQPGVHTMRNVLAQFYEIYPKCPQNIAEVFFQDAYKTVGTRIQFRNTTVDVDLVAGTPEYNYDPTGEVMNVNSIYYLPTSNPSSWQIIWKKDTDEYDALRPGWRSWQTTSTPFECYIGSAPANTNLTGGQGVLGLWPPPLASTVGSSPNDYPKVRLFVTTNATPALDDPLPVNLLDDNVYIYQMCEAYAKRYAPQEMKRWFDPVRELPYSEIEFQRNVVHVKDKLTDKLTIVQPGWAHLNMGPR